MDILIGVIGALVLCFLTVGIGVWLGNWTFNIGVPKEKAGNKSLLERQKEIQRRVASREGRGGRKWD